MDYAKLTCANLDICTVEKQYIYIHILGTTYWYLDFFLSHLSLHCTYCTYIYIYTCIYIYIYVYIYIYTYVRICIYIYIHNLDIQRVLLSIFNIPHILCKIYSTNIFTYIVYITSTVDTVHVAYTIYILSKSTYTIYIYIYTYIYVQYIYI